MLVTKLFRNKAINIQLNIKHHGGYGGSVFTRMPVPAVGPTHSPLQWVLMALSLGIKLPECEVDHLHLVLRFRMSGATPLCLSIPFFYKQGENFTFTCTLTICFASITL
jgi:hypothetical protein